MRVKIIDSWFLFYHILITALELNYNTNQVCGNSGEMKTDHVCVKWHARNFFKVTKCFRNLPFSISLYLQKNTKEVSFQVNPYELFPTCSFNQSLHFMVWKNYELDLCCSPSSSFISLSVRTNFREYSKLLGEETSRNHQAYRRGHLSSQ